MTETTLLCAVTDALCPVTKYGSVGRLAASSEAKIIDLKTGTCTMYVGKFYAWYATRAYCMYSNCTYCIRFLDREIDLRISRKLYTYVIYCVETITTY